MHGSMTVCVWPCLFPAYQDLLRRLSLAILQIAWELALKASIGLGEHGLNTSPKLGTYTPLPYLVVLPAPYVYFRELLQT